RVPPQPLTHHLRTPSLHPTPTLFPYTTLFRSHSSSASFRNSSRRLTPPRATANPTVGVFVPNRFRHSPLLTAARYPRIFCLISSSLSVLRSSSKNRQNLYGLARSGCTIRKSIKPSG